MSPHAELQTRLKPWAAYKPCLPWPAITPPSTSEWIHEIKHDGFRILARKDNGRVRLFTRNGYDFTTRYPLIVDAIMSLPADRCLVDGEAIVTDTNGLSVFDLLRYRRHDQSVMLCAFDILELDGTNFRPSPIEERKQHLAALLRFLPPGITLSPIYKDDGRTIYNHACALGCEGIVSKRLGSPYHSGRTDQWLKVKNPLAAAARREREIDWAKR